MAITLRDSQRVGVVPRVDATHGMGDYVRDVLEAADCLGASQFHLVTHSAGALVGWEMLRSASDRLLSLTQISPVSPYGIGGTIDVEGCPAYLDYSGTGAWLAWTLGSVCCDVNTNWLATRWCAEFGGTPTKELQAELGSALTSVARMARADQDISDWRLSKIGSYGSPGLSGVSNATSPMYNRAGLPEDSNVPVLWIRGGTDVVSSDNSVFDLQVLGRLGVFPAYDPAMRPQPVVSQTRSWLERYKGRGGKYVELIVARGGHAVWLGREKFLAQVLAGFWETACA
jgi:pimeloyl-ACP methyl ester carboxylesterase